jgi:hypothetical protein
MPFGAGNLANLRCAAQALDMRKPVAIIGKPEAYAERDFAEGEVARMLDDLVRRGASALECVDSLPDWVAKTRGA